VVLEGQGIHAVWTRKALEREGFLVNQGSNAVLAYVRIDTQNSIPFWTLTVHADSSRYSTIYDLVMALRKRMKHQINVST
jgi:hypothetical protein